MSFFGVTFGATTTEESARIVSSVPGNMDSIPSNDGTDSGLDPLSSNSIYHIKSESEGERQMTEEEVNKLVHDALQRARQATTSNISEKIMTAPTSTITSSTPAFNRDQTPPDQRHSQLYQPIVSDPSQTDMDALLSPTMDSLIGTISNSNSIVSTYSSDSVLKKVEREIKVAKSAAIHMTRGLRPESVLSHSSDHSDSVALSPMTELMGILNDHLQDDEDLRDILDTHEDDIIDEAVEVSVVDVTLQSGTHVDDTKDDHSDATNSTASSIQASNSQIQDRSIHLGYNPEPDVKVHKEHSSEESNENKEFGSFPKNSFDLIDPLKFVKSEKNEHKNSIDSNPSNPIHEKNEENTTCNSMNVVANVSFLEEKDSRHDLQANASLISQPSPSVTSILQESSSVENMLEFQSYVSIDRLQKNGSDSKFDFADPESLSGALSLDRSVNHKDLEKCDSKTFEQDKVSGFGVTNPGTTTSDRSDSDRQSRQESLSPTADKIISHQISESEDGFAKLNHGIANDVPPILDDFVEEEGFEAEEFMITWMTSDASSDRLEDTNIKVECTENAVASSIVASESSCLEEQAQENMNDDLNKFSSEIKIAAENISSNEKEEKTPLFIDEGNETPLDEGEKEKSLQRSDSEERDYDVNLKKLEEFRITRDSSDGHFYHEESNIVLKMPEDKDSASRLNLPESNSKDFGSIDYGLEKDKEDRGDSMKVVDDNSEYTEETVSICNYVNEMERETETWNENQVKPEQGSNQLALVEPVIAVDESMVSEDFQTNEGDVCMHDTKDVIKDTPRDIQTKPSLGDSVPHQKSESRKELADGHSEISRNSGIHDMITCSSPLYDKSNINKVEMDRNQETEASFGINELKSNQEYDLVNDKEMSAVGGSGVNSLLDKSSKALKLYSFTKASEESTRMDEPIQEHLTSSKAFIQPKNKKIQFHNPYPYPPPLPKPRPSSIIIQDYKMGVPVPFTNWSQSRPELEKLFLAARDISLQRRSNACGALKVLSQKKRNQLALVRTKGFLDSLVYTISSVIPRNKEEDIALDARARAVSTLLNVTSPKGNRQLILVHPGVLECVMNVIEQDLGEARVQACAILALLAKTPANREYLATFPGVLDVLAAVLLGKESDVIDNPSDTIVESDTESGDDELSRGSNSSSSVDYETAEELEKNTSSDYNTYDEEDAPSATEGSMENNTYDEEDAPSIEDSSFRRHKSIRDCKDALQSQFLKQARVNGCAALLHLSKQCAISNYLVTNQNLVQSLIEVSTEFETPIHTKCIEILCNLTRFPANSELLARNSELIEALVRCGKSKDQDDRIWSMRSFQNLGADSACKAVLANSQILTLLSICAMRDNYDEQHAAIASIFNLSTEPGAVVALTNTRNVIATLVHLAHNHSSAREIRRMACDALATIGLWLQTLAGSGTIPKDIEHVFLPTHTSSGWEKWD